MSASQLKEVRWARVSKANPCKICGKPDWCTVSEIGYCCMRSTGGTPLKNGGYLHKLDGSTPATPIPQTRDEPVYLDAQARLDQWARDRRVPLSQLSIVLGVTTESLSALSCIKAPQYQAWAFPMRAGDNSIVGIRIRNERGEKWAEKGSRQGLFIPQTQSQELALICEGPTDTAAALTIGYFAIGRPSCLGCVEHIQLAIRRLAIRRVCIVSDLDDAGLRGAKTLAEHLPIQTAILVCPAKDIRAFVNNGGNKEMLDAMMGQLVWRRPHA